VLNLIVSQLDELLFRRNLSQRKVARGTGLSINTIRGVYNNDSKRIDYDTIDKICEFLDITVGELLVYKKEEKSGDSSGD
jgi:putative transcriptional regulator